MQLKALTAALLLAAAVIPAQAEDYNWSGLYAGAHAGYAWGNAEHTQTNGGMPFGPFGYSPEGMFGGATGGINWQVSQIVFGIEADVGYLDLSGEGRIPSSTPPHYQALEIEGGLYALLGGRVGFAWDRTLIYAKGGRVYLDGAASQATTKPGFQTQASGNLDGWAYGGGVEHAFTDRISLKLEYLHFDFGRVAGSQTSITDPPIGFVYENATDVSADTVKIGVNFKIN